MLQIQPDAPSMCPTSRSLHVGMPSMYPTSRSLHMGMPSMYPTENDILTQLFNK